MNQPHPIAIIAGQLVVGGAERQLYLWLSNLDRRKFSPVVLTLHPGHDDYWEKPIEDLGIPLLRIPHYRFKFMRLLNIVKVLRPYQPRLIHGWHLFASPYAGATARLLGAKSIGSLRGSFQSFQSSRLESKLTLFLVDSLLANSRSAGEQLKKNKKNSHVVVNAVEEQIIDRQDLRQKISKQFGISTAKIWIVSLGRLDGSKRFDLLLQTIKILYDDAKDFHFILIGDGVERANLEMMAGELGINPCITFAGEIPGASAWLSAFDIFCFTSLDEGLPNVIMEAAAANLPIVSWRTPFIEELLDQGRFGLLAEPPGEISELKKILSNLISSAEMRRKMGQAAHDHIVKMYSVDRFVNQMTEVYEILLKEKFEG